MQEARHSSTPPQLPLLPCAPAGLAWEWMEDWLKVQEGKSGGQMPKQYRLGQFKGGG